MRRSPCPPHPAGERRGRLSSLPTANCLLYFVLLFLGPAGTPSTEGAETWGAGEWPRPKPLAMVERPAGGEAMPFGGGSPQC